MIEATDTDLARHAWAIFNEAYVDVVDGTGCNWDRVEAATYKRLCAEGYDTNTAAMLAQFCHWDLRERSHDHGRERTLTDADFAAFTEWRTAE